MQAGQESVRKRIADQLAQWPCLDMFSVNWLKVMIVYVVVVVAVFGLSTHVFSVRRRRARISCWMTTYSVTVMVVFGSVYGREILHDYQTNQMDPRNATKVYAYINILAALVSYGLNLCLAAPLRDFFNGVRVFEVIGFLAIDGRTSRRAVGLMALKAILVPFVIENTLLLRQTTLQPERPLTWTLATLFPGVIAAIFPNCFFGVLVLCRLLVRTLNERLTEISRQVNFLQTSLQMRLQKPYYRMRIFCEMADQLDTLAEKYSVICTQTTAYLHLMAVPFVLSLLANLGGMVAGFFTQYLAIAESLINGEAYDAFNSLTNSVFLITSLAEITFQANMCHLCLVAVQETGRILQDIELRHADDRFRTAVESFTLLIQTKNFKITPLGLVDINIALVHDVFATVTSFLLILIQSDLTLRFSLQ